MTAIVMRRGLLSLQPFLAAAWLLAAGIRAGQGDWLVAFLDAYIALLTYHLWVAWNGSDRAGGGS